MGADTSHPTAEGFYHLPPPKNCTFVLKSIFGSLIIKFATTLMVNINLDNLKNVGQSLRFFKYRPLMTITDPPLYLLQLQLYKNDYLCMIINAFSKGRNSFKKLYSRSLLSFNSIFALSAIN